MFRNRELRSPTEARERLTKFFVIIIIAVTLEALVFVLGAAKDLALLVYPAMLLGIASVMMVALALYLRLSSHAEERLPDPDASTSDG